MMSTRLDHNIVHISDLHFGTIASNAILDSLIDSVYKLKPSRIIISGDITQRARIEEFEKAKIFTDKFDQLCRVVPGNHDIEPWWKPIKRLSNPLYTYHRYYNHLDCETIKAGRIGLIYLSSADERSIQGGTIDNEYLLDSFSSIDPTKVDWLVVVTHHPLLRDPAIKKSKLCNLDYAALLNATKPFENVLFLSGHTHAQSIYELARTGGRTLISSVCGTTSSNRKRRKGQYRNTFLNICFRSDGGLQVDAYIFQAESATWLLNEGLSRSFQIN